MDTKISSIKIIILPLIPIKAYQKSGFTRNHSRLKIEESIHLQNRSKKAKIIKNLPLIMMFNKYQLLLPIKKKKLMKYKISNF